MSAQLQTPPVAPVEAPVARAKPPVSVPAVARLAILLALVLVGAGAVLVRDALAAGGAITGSPWSSTVLEALDGLVPASWMVPAGVALALVGVSWVLVAFTPRRRTELTLDPAGVAFIRPQDVARIARATAGDVDGVLTASASASRRRVKVSITALGEHQAVGTAVRDAVRAALAPVHPVPAVTVSARAAGGTS